MDASPVFWWSAAQGFMPALPTGSVADISAGAVVVGIQGQGQREAARRTIREEVVSSLVALTGLAAERIHLHAAPGEAPYALLEDHGVRRRAALSISHDGELSLAAIRFDGDVGIDVMRVVDFPDWQAVARDYLGPALAASLSALAPARRAAAFARAWSEREARLKCLGVQLGEWNTAGERRLAACSCTELALPDGYVGFLAL
jgi:4'-phosphopantetheinyl transferase